MRFRYQLIVVVLLASMGTVLTGCSKQLSRGLAGDLIQRHKEFADTSNIQVAVGRCWFDWRDIKDFYGKLAPYKPLQSTGILTIRESGKSYSLWWKEYIVELTPRGQQEAKMWIRTSDKPAPAGDIFRGPDSEGTVYSIPLAEKKLVEVTGMAINQSGNEADVQFDWRWLPTPQGKPLASMAPNGETQHGEAALRLYDDGWRIEQLVGVGH
jgi:hypothetical protein